MIKRIIATLIIILLSSANVYAEALDNIEIFSINEEKVVKVVHANPQIQGLAENYLHGIDGIYSKFNPVPSNGYAVKIPMGYPIKIEGKWLNTFIDMVIVMFPEDESPFLMVFENEDEMACFTFKGETGTLWSLLNFSPYPQHIQ